MSGAKNHQNSGRKERIVIVYCAVTLVLLGIVGCLNQWVRWYRGNHPEYVPGNPMYVAESTYENKIAVLEDEIHELTVQLEELKGD